MISIDAAKLEENKDIKKKKIIAITATIFFTLKNQPKNLILVLMRKHCNYIASFDTYQIF